MWVPHDVRDQVVDFVRCWSEKTDIGAGRFIHWLGVISGSSRGSGKRSSVSIGTIRWKATDIAVLQDCYYSSARVN